MSDFKCPSCGASNFRSDITKRPWEGQCKGFYVPGAFYSYTGCDFTWERTVEEDAKVGLVVEP